MATINVIVETPKGSVGKFDRDPATGMMLLNKILPKGLVFPYDFGFVPGTTGEDGDPVDVVVICEMGTSSGCALECRLIGAIKATQRERDGDKMRNDRLLAVPIVSREYEKVEDISDLPKDIINELELFFATYNVQAGKKFNPFAQVGAKAAADLVEKARKNNNNQSWLIQIFIPVNPTARNAQDKKLGKLKTDLSERYGGLTVYAQGPVEGKWIDRGTTITDNLLVFEVMAGEIDTAYLKKLKVALQKQFHQKEILIRCQQIGVL